MMLLGYVKFFKHFNEIGWVKDEENTSKVLKETFLNVI